MKRMQEDALFNDILKESLNAKYHLVTLLITEDDDHVGIVRVIIKDYSSDNITGNIAEKNSALISGEYKGDPITQINWTTKAGYYYTNDDYDVHSFTFDGSEIECQELIGGNS